MPFSYDTMITVSNGSKKSIQEFAIGDPVWVAKQPDLKAWEQKPVMFSSGTGDHERNVLMRITFENGSGTSVLLVTKDQPFLMPDKTLKKAERLVPNRDVLLTENGKTCPILSLEVGMYDKGIHDIATSNMPVTSMDGHLLIANGIVAGDYSLSMVMRADMSQSAE